MNQEQGSVKPVHEMGEDERNAEREFRLAEIVSRLKASNVLVETRGDTILMGYQGLVISIYIDARDPRMIIFGTAFGEGEPDLIQAILAASKATERSFGAKATVQGDEESYGIKISYESIYPSVDDLFSVIGFPLAFIADCRETYISERAKTSR